MPPTVSVVIPCYNAASHLERTIRSALEQTVAPTEILCIDDGSKDATWDILQRLAEESSLVRPIQHELNRGVAAARTTGCENAAGEWIAFLDSDDLWVPEKLELQLALLDEHPDAALLHGDAWSETDDDQATRKPMLRHQLVRDDDPIMTLFAANWVITSVTMIRTDWTRRIGPFRAYDGVVEDHDYWLRFTLAGAKFAHVDQPLAVYRKHGTGLSASEVRMPRGKLACLEANLLSRPKIIDRIGRENLDGMRIYHTLGVVRGLMRQGNRSAAAAEWDAFLERFGKRPEVAELRKSLWPFGLRHRRATDRLRQTAKVVRGAVESRL
ncbi:glycosyltransferase family 2 protein [bacterium]|nr:glycosyltransferase family 2 protein [bacterium]